MQALLGIGMGLQGVVDQGFEAQHMLFGNAHGQVVLVEHIVVERGLGDAAGRSHLVHGGARIAALREQLGGVGEDHFTLAIVASRVTYACHAAASFR